MVWSLRGSRLLERDEVSFIGADWAVLRQSNCSTRFQWVLWRRLFPVHSLRSVERYAQTYRNVLKLLEQGLAPTEVSGILNIGLGLVEAYVNLVDEHHPEVIAENPHLHKQGDNLRSDSPRCHLT